MILVAILSIFIMIAFAAKIGDFVNNHPSIKILALSFLLMIGTLLVAEASITKFQKDTLILQWLSLSSSS